MFSRDIDAAKSGKGLRAPGAALAVRRMPMAASPSDAQILALYEKGSYDVVPHDGMRKIIAQRLTLSKQTIPHFYLTLECHIDNLLAAREEINAPAPVRTAPGLQDLGQRLRHQGAGAGAERVPAANVTWTEAGTLRHKYADVGVAVAIPGGLITPWSATPRQVALGHLQ